MPQPDPPHRHNGGPLSDDDARKLWGHVRALEILDEQANDIREDQKARKSLAKADGFDTNILAAILKRRKVGAGETLAADTLVKLYEEGLLEQGALPLEKTRITPEQRRRDVEEIGQTLHGESAPDMPEKAPVSVGEIAARAAEESVKSHPNVSITVGDQTFGGGPDDPF